MDAFDSPETATPDPNSILIIEIIKSTGMAGLLVLLFFLTGCSRNAAPKPAAASTDLPNAAATPSQQEVAKIASLAKGHVGVSAVILETGETITALNSQDHFPMQSVYKLPISMTVMKQIDAGKMKLEQKVKIAREDYVG